MPFINIPLCQYNLSFRIGFYELFRERGSRKVADSLTVTKQLVKVFPVKRFPNSIVFGSECFIPQFAISRVL